MDNFISKLKNISTSSSRSKSVKAEASLNGSGNYSLNNSSDHQHLSSNQSLLRSNSRDEPELLVETVEPVPRSPRRLRPRRPVFRHPWLWGLVLFAGASGGAVAFGYWKIEHSLPDVKDISSFVRNGTITIQAADGTILQQLGPATREKLSYEQIPPRLVQAFVAAEDRRFFQHNGVDYQSIARAIAKNLVSRDVVEGASTITQQLARTVYLNQERSLWRKLQEAFLAQKIERELTKQQVMERYLNLVYLGSSAYGVADAAWVYFSKSVDQLTLPEMATIAGLPPAPSDYSPLVNPNMAEERRDIVLERMQEAGYISASEADAARSQPLKLKPGIPKRLFSEAPYFTTYVQQQLPKLISKEQLELGGLTIETTLNPYWQTAAEKAVVNATKNIGPSEGFKHAAMVAIDPATGEIRAMVGGTDTKSGQFNRATQAQRQPGSAFKAILYTTAIATGISPYATYLDAPYSVDGYKPENYGRKYNGWMSLRDALTNSVNIVSVKLLLDVGFDPIIKMAHDMGIKSKLFPTYSLALGASEVNLLELTNAYSTLAAGGIYTEAHGIRRIVNGKGDVLYDANIKSKRVIDKDSVAIATWMMQNVVNSGTGQAAQIDRPVAGKTGTSEEARDLWFIGFIPQLVAGVWLGNDDNSPTWSYSSTAALVWHDFMVFATKGMPIKPFPELPNNLGTRKGSVKAKPVRPQRSYTLDKPADNSTGQPVKRNPAPADSSNNTPANNATPAPAEPSPSPEDTPPTSPPVPEPVAPPPPSNTAPPELPPVAPAPAAPPGSPTPAQ